MQGGVDPVVHFLGRQVEGRGLADALEGLLDIPPHQLGDRFAADLHFVLRFDFVGHQLVHPGLDVQLLGLGDHLRGIQVVGPVQVLPGHFQLLAHQGQFVLGGQHGEVAFSQVDATEHLSVGRLVLALLRQLGKFLIAAPHLRVVDHLVQGQGCTLAVVFSAAQVIVATAAVDAAAGVELGQHLAERCVFAALAAAHLGLGLEHARVGAPGFLLQLPEVQVVGFGDAGSPDGQGAEGQAQSKKTLHVSPRSANGQRRWSPVASGIAEGCGRQC